MIPEEEWRLCGSKRGVWKLSRNLERNREGERRCKQEEFPFFYFLAGRMIYTTPWTILELSPSLKNISFVAITWRERNKSTLFTVYLNELKSKIAGRSYRCKRAVTSVHPSRKFLADFREFLLNLRSFPPFLSNVSPASVSWEDNPSKST